jgi:hypothetical protein
MGYNGCMVTLTLIIIAIALVLGYFVALSTAIRPTLGDVLRATMHSYGIPAIAAIAFIWWVGG